MTNREAGNVAWHARVNGLDGISKENMVAAMVVLERLVEDVDKLRREQNVVVERLVAEADALRRERDSAVEQYRSTWASLRVIADDAKERLSKL